MIVELWAKKLKWFTALGTIKYIIADGETIEFVDGYDFRHGGRVYSGNDFGFDCADDSDELSIIDTDDEAVVTLPCASVVVVSDIGPGCGGYIIPDGATVYAGGAVIKKDNRGVSISIDAGRFYLPYRREVYLTYLTAGKLLVSVIADGGKEIEIASIAMEETAR